MGRASACLEATGAFSPCTVQRGPKVRLVSRRRQAPRRPRPKLAPPPRQKKKKKKKGGPATTAPSPKAKKAKGVIVGQKVHPSDFAFGLNKNVRSRLSNSIAKLRESCCTRIWSCAEPQKRFSRTAGGPPRSRPSAP